MAEGLAVALIFAALGFMGWLHESQKRRSVEKKYSRRLDAAITKFDAERQRRLISEQQVEWFRSRSNHPALRRGSK